MKQWRAISGDTEPKSIKLIYYIRVSKMSSSNNINPGESICYPLSMLSSMLADTGRNNYWCINAIGRSI